MSNNQPPAEEKIKADAERSIREQGEVLPLNEAYVEGYEEGYIAGATSEVGRNDKENEKEIDRILHAERNKMQAKISSLDKEWADRAQVLVDALVEAKKTIEWMWKHLKDADGQSLLQVDHFNRPANALHIIDLSLQQWKGKEVENG